MCEELRRFSDTHHILCYWDRRRSDDRRTQRRTTQHGLVWCHTSLQCGRDRRRHRHLSLDVLFKCKGIFLHRDALGLAVFSIIGTQAAITMGYSIMICLVAALITGVFGGLLRDLLCRQKPLVLHEERYAIVSLLASGLYLGLNQLGASETTTILITVGFSYGFRMLPIRYQWRLPLFHLEPEHE